MTTAAAPTPATAFDPETVTPDTLREVLRYLDPVERMELFAALEGRRREDRQQTFREFIVARNLKFRWSWHHEILVGRLQDVADGLLKMLIVNEPPRHGKALAVNTPIPTPRGWVRMGDLAPGDEVFAVDGTVTRVRAVSETWRNRPVYRVANDSGQSVIADAAHEWNVRLDRKGKRVSTRETVWLYDRQQRMGDFRAPMVVAHGPLELPTRDLPIAPYTLGAWLGDGCSRQAYITQGADDAPHILGRIASDGYRLRAHKDSRNTGILGLSRQLVRARLIGDKRIPAAYLRASTEQRVALLQGLIDTDGHVAPGGQVEYSTTSSVLADGVRELVTSLGVKAALITGRATIDGRDCGPKYRVMFYYDRAASIPRKAARCRSGVRTPGHYLTIEPAGFADTVCIEVEHPSHLFLCGFGMVPTHNSEVISRLFAAYWLYRHPDTFVGLAAFGDTLVKGHSRAVARYFTGAGGEIKPDVSAVGHWETPQDGGLWTTGILGGAMGKGFSLGIIDDPYKSEKEAQSDTVRLTVEGFYDSTFYTRRAPDAAIVVIMTRWHEDDLVAWLLRAEADAEDTPEGWHVIAFDAIHDRAEFDEWRSRLPRTVTVEPDPRSDGDALWPDRWDIKRLRKIRRRMGGALGYRWRCLYQQRPSAREGGFFRMTEVKTIDREKMPRLLREVRGWDRSATEGCGSWDEIGPDNLPNDDADWTVGVRQGYDARGDYYVTGFVMGQWSPGKRDAIIRQTVKADGRAVHQRGEQEPGAGGKGDARAFRILCAGYAASTEPSTEKKEIRATPLASVIESGRYFVVRGAWNEPFYRWMRAFGPGVKWDDVPDATSIGHNWLAMFELRDTGIDPDDVNGPDEPDDENAGGSRITEEFT